MDNLYEPERPLLDVFAFPWRHKGKLLLTFAVGVGLTLAYLSLAGRKFQSDAKLFVRIGRESVTLDPTATTGQFVAVADSRESEVLAVQELLTSRGLAERLVDQLGPAAILEKAPNRKGLRLSQRLAWLEPYNLNPLKVYSQRDKAVQAFQENLGVATGKRTSVLSVSYKAGNPQLAHDVLAALLQEAREEHLRVNRTTGSQEFFERQCAQLSTELIGLEEKLRDLKGSTGLASLSVQRQLQLEMIGALQGEHLRANAEQDAVLAEVESRKSQLRDAPALVVTEQLTGQPQTSQQTMREKLYDLEVKEQELASKLKDESPQLVQLREQIAEARRISVSEQATTQVTKGLNQTRQAAELALQERSAQLVALNARTQSLATKIATAQDELKQLNASEVDFARLDRKIELSRTNYRKYAENLEQARIDQELQAAKISSLNLMQPPTLAQTPVSPQPIPTLALGLAASLVFSLGVALLAEFRRSRSPAAAPTTIVRELPAVPTPHRQRRAESVAATAQ